MKTEGAALRTRQRIVGVIGVALWITMIVLAATGCSVFAPSLAEKADQVVEHYCVTPFEQREVLRAVVNRELAPHCIDVVCAGDPPTAPSSSCSGSASVTSPAPAAAPDVDETVIVGPESPPIASAQDLRKVSPRSLALRCERGARARDRQRIAARGHDPVRARPRADGGDPAARFAR